MTELLRKIKLCILLSGYTSKLQKVRKFSKDSRQNCFANSNSAYFYPLILLSCKTSGKFSNRGKWRKGPTACGCGCVSQKAVTVRVPNTAPLTELLRKIKLCILLAGYTSKLQKVRKIFPTEMHALLTEFLRKIILCILLSGYTSKLQKVRKVFQPTHMRL